MAFASRAVCLLLVALALCQAASGQSPGTKPYVTALESIETESNKFRVELLLIDAVDVALIGSEIPRILRVIAQRIGEATTMLTSNPSPVSDDGARTVVRALRGFVFAEEALLKAVISKHNLLTGTEFFEPTRVALGILKGAVDSFKDYLIKALPTQNSSVEFQFGLLSTALQSAITTYEKPLP